MPDRYGMLDPDALMHRTSRSAISLILNDVPGLGAPVASASPGGYIFTGFGD